MATYAPIVPDRTLGQRALGWTRTLVWTALWLALAVVLIGSLRGGPALPRQAPSFEARDLDGKLVRLADLRGRPVVLYFWASWCTACKLTSPTIAAYAASHPDVPVLGIAMEDESDVRRYLGDDRPPYVVVPETLAIQQTYPIRALPTTVVLDKAGLVAWSRQGMLLPGELNWHVN